MPELSHKYQVQMVPTVVFTKCGIAFDRVDGFDTYEVISKMSDLVLSEDVDLGFGRVIDELIKKNQIVVVLESDKSGVPSKDLIHDVLADFGLSYAVYFLELTYTQIAFLQKKGYLGSGFPQIYRDGVQIGVLTCTHVKEEVKNQLTKLLLMSIDERIKELIASSKVMLFMKGTPDQPRCGFSRRIVEILRSKGVEFGHFDILSDQEVRTELKRYSNWQTYPQLYIDSELIGGLDVVKELVDNDELFIN